MKFLYFFTSFLLVSVLAMAQGTETFTNMPASASGYAVRTWTGDNGLQWTANDARTDQEITGRAIGLRFGTLSCANIPNGIGNLSFKYKYLFTAGGDAVLNIKINGNTVGTLTVPATATTAATATFDNINIAGTFTLEIVETLSGPRVAIDDVSWTAGSNTPCAAPTAQPTGLVFGTSTSSTISGSFTAASPAADEYLVVASTSATLGAAPANGTIYNIDDVLGNGIVVARSSSVAFVADGLSAGTTYYFFVFSVNSACNGGPLYNSTNPLTASAATTTPPACAGPAVSVSNLVINPASASVTGSYTLPANADGALVVYSTSNALTFAPANGVTYTVGQTVGSGNTGTVGSFAPGGTFSVSGLTVSTTYYFYVFASAAFNCSGGPLYSSASTNGSTTTSGSGSGAGIPAGYYTNAAGKSCADLKTALKTITTTGMTPRGYGDLWSQYLQTDVKPREVGSGSANVIWDIYSDNPNGPDPYNFTPGTHQCGSYSGEGQCYNREHSFPQSWFTTGTSAGPGTDYHHIFPTDGKVNANRGSYVYGEVASATITSLNGSKLGTSAVAGINGPVFEPINTYKGDVARAFLYMVTRYQDNMPTWGNLSGSNGLQALAPNTYPSVDVAYLKLMIKWHNQDPVSQKERDRNNGGYSFQKNRNPFVDHPEYVDMVWNASCPGLSALPVQLVFFGGKLENGDVKLNWIAENEVNFSHYEVERSFNGTQYRTLAQVKAAGLRQYVYNDGADALSGRRVYYRLKKVDKDGRFTYSEVFTLHVPANTRFTVYPNPAKDVIRLQLNKNVQGMVTVQVTDALGKVLQQQTLVASGSLVEVSAASLTSGTYLVKLLVNGQQYVQKVMVAK